MNEPDASTIEINGFATRVWRKGTGPKLGFLAGFGGLPRWVPFLDRLSEALDKALADETVRKRITDIGCDVPEKARWGQQALATLMKNEVGRWVPVIKAANKQ